MSINLYHVNLTNLICTEKRLSKVSQIELNSIISQNTSPRLGLLKMYRFVK